MEPVKCDCCGLTFQAWQLWTCERCGQLVCVACVAVGAGNPAEHGYAHGMGLCVRCYNAQHTFDVATGEREVPRPCTHE